MTNPTFAVLGAGFWSQYQLAAWQELKEVRCIAVYNRTRAKAETLARQFGIPAVYDDPTEMLTDRKPGFVDIITDVATHRQFVELAAENAIPVICQKPLAPTLADARCMVEACRRASVPFLVHENWRWQTPLRQLKAELDRGTVGPVFRARLTYSNSFPVFENQPFLKQLEQFLLTDIGTHILDTARMLFGEARTLFCRTSKVHHDIKGEDVATVMLEMVSGVTVTCEMSYASRVEHDRFPETFVMVEGELGSIELGPDYWLRVTTETGTHARRCPPPFYSWVEPRYALVQSAGVACNANLLSGLRGETPAETTGEDNLKTLELVFGAYESARLGQCVGVNR
jgi:D-apiose dehydrogenase